MKNWITNWVMTQVTGNFLWLLENFTWLSLFWKPLSTVQCSLLMIGLKSKYVLNLNLEIPTWILTLCPQISKLRNITIYIQAYTHFLGAIGWSLGLFANYVNQILDFFCVDIFRGMNFDKKWAFVDHLPILSCKRSLWTMLSCGSISEYKVD